nr:RnfH family protein [Rhodoferax sp.]
MTVNVEVVYATHTQTSTVKLEVARGSTVETVLLASGLMADPEVAACVNAGRVGIYGRLVPLSQVVATGERVEIYRPLSADPKDVRRARAGKR